MPLAAIGVGAGTAIAGLAGAGAAVMGSRSASNAQRDASRIEQQSTNAALADAREERTYGRMTAEEQRRYDRMTYAEQQAYDRARYADEQQYLRGRDAQAFGLERDRFGFEREKFGTEQKNYGEERDFGRGQYANYLGRLEAFRAPGAGVMPALSSVVGRGVAASVPTMGGGGMVKLQAPNGQVTSVPAAHVEHYISRGAKRV